MSVTDPEYVRPDLDRDDDVPEQPEPKSVDDDEKDDDNA